MYNYLSPNLIENFVVNALKEDIGIGDFSTLACIPEDAVQSAQLLVKGNGILAGVELAKIIFSTIDKSLQVQTLIGDGAVVKKGDVALLVQGKARSILSAERLVLNCMQRMSGIATYTNYLSSFLCGTKAKLLDTRKTTPNFRIAEKWAVAIGGGINHRFGLFDMIMLKDNHIDYAGGIANALQRTHNYLKENQLDLKIVIETRNLAEVAEVLKAEQDANWAIQRILLDNMPIAMLQEAVQLIQGKYETEASGGITEQTIAAIAQTGVDYISVGALTHSAKSLDLSLKAK